jgi:hypothetical protein
MLEGGYSPEIISDCAANVVTALLDDSNEALPPLPALLPRPHPDFLSTSSSARQTPLGVVWRQYSEGSVRPEAVLEKTRRTLNNVFKEKLFVESKFKTTAQEPSVEEEFQVLQKVIKENEDELGGRRTRSTKVPQRFQ